MPSCARDVFGIPSAFLIGRHHFLFRLQTARRHIWVYTSWRELLAPSAPQSAQCGAPGSSSVWRRIEPRPLGAVPLCCRQRAKGGKKARSQAPHQEAETKGGPRAKGKQGHGTRHGPRGAPLSTPLSTYAKRGMNLRFSPRISLET